MSPGAGPPTRLGWRWGIFLFVLVAVVQTLSPDVQITDSRLTVPADYAVLHYHTLALDRVPSVGPALRQTSYDVVHIDGRTLPRYPWPPMLLALPAAALAEAAGAHVGTLSPSRPNKTWPIEVPTAAVIVAFATVVMALIALEVAGTRPGAHRFAMVVALIFAFATAAWSSGSRALWQHTPAMLASCLALLAAIRSKRDARYLWLLGFALTVGYMMRPTMSVVLVVLGLWAVYTHRLGALKVVAAGLVAAVPFIAVNVVYYHSLLAPYYTGSGNKVAEWYPFFESLGVQLVSPSRGLLVYTPLYLLAGFGVWIKLRYRDPETFGLDLSISVIVLLYVLVMALSGSTEGTAYGNRFFVDIIPFLIYLCFPALERLILTRDLSRRAPIGSLSLIILSAGLAAPGALTHSALCWSTTPRLVTDAPERVWDWSDP